MSDQSERPRPTITIPSDAPQEEIERLQVLHALAALGEGMCPSCAGDLEKAEGDSRNSPGTGRPWLYCPACPSYWQADHERQEVTWEAWWAWHGINCRRSGI